MGRGSSSLVHSARSPCNLDPAKEKETVDTLNVEIRISHLLGRPHPSPSSPAISRWYYFCGMVQVLERYKRPCQSPHRLVEAWFTHRTDFVHLHPFCRAGSVGCSSSADSLHIMRYFSSRVLFEGDVEVATTATIAVTATTFRLSSVAV